MKYISIILLLLAFGVSCSSGKPEQVKLEPVGVHKAIIGKWHLEEIWGDGNVDTNGVFTLLEFTDDMQILSAPGKKEGRTFRYKVEEDSTIKGHHGQEYKILEVGYSHLVLMNKMGEFAELDKAPSGYKIQTWHYRRVNEN